VEVGQASTAPAETALKNSCRVVLYTRADRSWLRVRSTHRWREMDSNHRSLLLTGVAPEGYCYAACLNESWPVSAKATSRGARVFKTYAGWSAAGDHPRRALLVSQKAKVGVAAAVAHDRRLMEGARSSKNYGPPRGAFAGSMGANSARRSPLAGV